jgi:hypothetical protein
MKIDLDLTEKRLDVARRHPFGTNLNDQNVVRADAEFVETARSDGGAKRIGALLPLIDDLEASIGRCNRCANRSVVICHWPFLHA